MPITLEGFRWGMVGASLREARISLLLLVARRDLRLLRHPRPALGAILPLAGRRRSFASVYSATLAGFACTLVARPRRRAGAPGADRPEKLHLDASHVRRLRAGARGGHGGHGSSGGWSAAVFRAARDRRAGNDLLLRLARSAGALLLLGLVGVIAFLVYFRYHGGKWLAKKLEHPSWRKGWRAKVAALLEGFSDGLRGVRTWGDLAALAAYTALHWILVVLIYLWIAHAFGGQLASLSFAGAALVLAFTMVGSAAQLPGVGGGSQLASFLVFTLIFGVDKEPAAVATVVIWLITFVGCCVVGFPLLFREGWSVGELKRMARAEEQAGEAELLIEAEHGGELPARSKETLK